MGGHSRARPNVEVIALSKEGMESFGPNLDGYYDVENQLPRHLRERAATTFEQTAAEKDAVRSVDDHEQRVRDLREAFLAELGGLPDERTSLHADTTSVLDRDGYTVETVVFESLPDFHVTGTLYRPDGTGPFPAVLFLCGHTSNGKAAGGYQQACIELATNGFVVLAIDPIGQGERIQSYDPETGEHARQNVLEHTYLGQQCLVAGANLTRYFVWDMVRAIDYLESRDDVDASRIGATGNSGGGMQTGFLMLLEDRIDAAVPCCFVTSREVYMESGQAQDGEQIIHRAIDHGLDYDDYIAAFAPRPALIGAAQSDFLCIDGCLDSFDRAHNVYDLYDRPDHIDLAVADDTHGLSPPLREAMVNWFREHLRGLAPDYTVGDPNVEDEATLQCTDTGQVHGTYSNERHVVDLNRAFVREQHGDVGSTPAVTDPDDYANRIRTTVHSTFDLDRPATPLFPRRIATEVDETAGVRWEKTFFYAEPGVIVAGIVAVALESPAQVRPTVVLPDHGTSEFDAHEDRVAALARERGLAMVFDPRGVGAVRARDVNTPQSNGGTYFDYHGTEYKLASDAIMLGTSLFGLRVFDVLRARDYLAQRAADLNLNVDGFGLDGVGVGALHALVAAAAEPTFRAIRIANLPYSFYQMATREEYEIDFRLRAHGVVGVCDVPQLLPVLSDRAIEWVDTDPDEFR